MSETGIRLRVAVIGAGMRSRSVWLRLVTGHDACDLVGLADPAPTALTAAVETGLVQAISCFEDTATMLATVSPDLVIACPIIDAHGTAVRAALEHNCHVLVEKPFVTDIDEAISLANLADSQGVRLAVVQNWRTKSAGAALRTAITAGRIGAVSHIAFRYLRDREKPHLPEYLFDEDDAVLWAMGIHHFDLFRYVLQDEIISAKGMSFTPEWSRYRTPSIVDLSLKTAGGVLISYVASFSSRNAHIPQESMQIEGALGTLYNDSQYFEPPLLLSLRDSSSPIDLTLGAPRGEREQYDLADAAVLENMIAAVFDPKVRLIADGRDNIGTLQAIDLARQALRGS